jgi:hypothetical protein
VEEEASRRLRPARRRATAGAGGMEVDKKSERKLKITNLIITSDLETNNI